MPPTSTEISKFQRLRNKLKDKIEKNGQKVVRIRLAYTDINGVSHDESRKSMYLLRFDERQEFPNTYSDVGGFNIGAANTHRRNFLPYDADITEADVLEFSGFRWTVLLNESDTKADMVLYHEVNLARERTQ